MTAPGRTHADQPGAGNPRLVLGHHGHDTVDSVPDGDPDVGQVTSVEFPLDDGDTIGGDAGDTIRLHGLPAAVGRVRRDDRDEYRLTVQLEDPAVHVNGEPLRPSGSALLRTGDRVDVGGWTLSYMREEFADHGRPHGGRQGGELSDQEPQDPPR